MTAAHVRAIEDRAHGAVDTARQEVKSLRQERSALQRTGTRQEATLASERAAHAKAIAKAERDLVAAQTKAQTLASTLSAFKDGLRTAAAKKATDSRKSCREETTRSLKASRTGRM